MIRVAIADGHALMREGLKHILREFPSIAVVAEAGDGHEVITRSRAGGFDVFMLELSMPGCDGIALIRQLRLETPSIAILVLTLQEAEMHATAAFRAGARGFLNKSATPEELVAAIHCAASGRPFVSPAVAEQLAMRTVPHAGQLPHISLSEREHEVFANLAAGQSVKQIADRLDISIKTVSTHKARMMEKMGLSTISQLVQYAIEQGLLPTSAE